MNHFQPALNVLLITITIFHNSWSKCVLNVQSVSLSFQIYLIRRWEKVWPWLISYERSLCKCSLSLSFLLSFLILQILLRLLLIISIFFCRFVFKINMPSNVRVKLINDLADIEYVVFILLKFNFNQSCHRLDIFCWWFCSNRDT